MKRITIYVKETLWHQVEIDLDDDEAKKLERDLQGDHKDDYAGDMTNGRMTTNEGEFEFVEYEIEDVNA